MGFLEWLKATPLSEWVSGSDYGFYIVLAGHAVGMAVVTGTMFMVALRVLGYSRSVPLRVFDRLFTIAWVGFALNFVTGLALFTANGEHLVGNTAFQIKIGMLAVGGVAVYLTWRAVEADPAVIDGDGVAKMSTRVLAAATLFCWITAIVAGRIIGYTIDY